MTRTGAREIAVRLVFSMNATEAEPEAMLEEFFENEHFATLKGEDELYNQFPDAKQMEYIRRLVSLCYMHNYEFSGYIARYSKGWKPERISSMASTIIRCAMCEIMYMDDIPNSAAINEAVELAKSYEESETVAFINGVLGGFVRGEGYAEDVRPGEIEEPDEPDEPAED